MPTINITNGTFNGTISYDDPPSGGGNPGGPPGGGGSAPIITNLRPASATRSRWDIVSGSTTISNHLLVFGTSDAAANITVLLNGNATGTVTADDNGKWSCDLPDLSDGAYAMTATANGSSPSQAFNVTIKPGITGVTVGNNLQNNASFYVGDLKHNTINDPKNSQACIVPNTHQFDITLGPNDLWPPPSGNNSNRSEVTMSDMSKGDGTTFDVTYEFLLSANSPVNNAFGSGNWFIISQLGDTPSSHGGPAMDVSLGNSYAGGGDSGDQFAVEGFINSKGTVWYKDPKDIVRGVWYAMDISMKPARSGGFIKVWRDGIQLVNATSGFYGSPGYWWKIGLYRGGTTNQTQIARYRNLQVVLS